MKVCIKIIIACLLSTQVFAQTDSIPAEEDFSQYANVEETPSSVKRYCSQKIIGISPSKLISLGYDFVAKNTLTTDTAAIGLGSTPIIGNNQGLRFLANFPVISNNKMILNLGFSYLDFSYQISNATEPIAQSLAAKALRSYGPNATLFKPLNETKFLILQSSFDFNGDFGIGELPSGKSLKISATAIYGVKKHERLQYGFGLARTYRAGAVNYVPLFLYNYTFQSRKWGFEILLPARLNVRYTINSRNMLFAGLELEGNSYQLKNLASLYAGSNYTNLQLRRSEIRPRLTYEFSVYKFIWMSLQAGYRIAYKFDVDDGEFFPLANADRNPVITNKLSSAPYFNVSVNLVSP